MQQIQKAGKMLNPGIASLIFLIAFSLVSIGCNKTMQANKIPDKELESGVSRIYILRPSYLAFVANADIYENNTIVGRIGSGKYLGWDTKPGEITLQGGNGFLKIYAKPGRTYYIKLVANFAGIRSPGFSFFPITEEEGKYYLRKLKMASVKVVG